MDKLQNFNFEGNNVRTILINNEPFFVGKDSALAIGYTSISFRNALKAHVKNKYKRECQINTPSGAQTMTVISEPGLYQLAGQSKLPSAEPFQDWIYEEVLPAIRKTGSYQAKPLSATEQLSLAVKSVLEINDRVTSLEDTMRVSGVQEQQLRMAVNKHVMQIIGGKEAPAYSKLGSSVFQQCWHDFKRYFEIPRYGELPRIKFDEGIRYVEAWLPDTETRLEIANQNAQGELFE